MIPVTLRLRNFLSYGEDVPALDFTQFHVACLSGPNGHGKSALLDAITWALWGEARKAPGERKPDDGLLRLGAREMQVEFVFDLEGDRYRVLRQYRRGKSGGRTVLEFQVYDPATDTYQTLTQPNLTATQRKIVETLRMDYETFVNSAFIQQGRADAFTQKSARERKAILSEILGLSRYDELAERARAHRLAAERDAQGAQAHCDELAAELEHLPEYRRQLEELKARLETLTADLAALEERSEALRTQRQELREKQRQAEGLAQTLARLDRNIAEAQEQVTQRRAEVERYRKILAQREEVAAQARRLASLQAQRQRAERLLQRLRHLEAERSRWQREVDAARSELEKARQGLKVQYRQARQTLEEAEKVLAQAGEIEAQLAQLQQAREEEERWESLRQEAEALEQRERALQQEIDAARNEVEVEVRTLRQRVQELQGLAAELPPRRQQLEQARAALAEAEQAAQEQETWQRRLNALQVRIETLKTQRDRLKEEIRSVEERQALVARGDTTDCPLCGSHLGPAGMERLRAHFAEEIQTRTAQIRSINREGKELVAQRKEIQARLTALATLKEQLPQRQRAVVAAEQALREAEEARAELGPGQQRLAEAEKSLRTHAYAPEKVRERDELQARRLELGYDPEAHRRARERVRQLQPYEREQARLETARAQWERAQAELPALERQLTEIETALAENRYAEEAQQKLREVEAQIAATPYDEEAVRQLDAELEALQDVPRRQALVEEARQRLGPTEEALAKLEQTLKERQQERETTAAEEEGLWAEVKALPEVERQLQETEQKLHAAQQTRDDLLQERGRVQNQVERCAQREEELAAAKKKLQQAQREQEVYHQLTVAFGKDGIQALIIENAVPEIEEKANEILGQLTNHRTHITIEPLRDLKSGGVKETLDIHISDELGTRSYELYSGGERFRVDFALRLALSHLLARRAGTKLRTLVIDEGFGTQDSEGLEQLVEAIQAVSREFDKILVVTHLESLKNSFPTRIEVRKHPEHGSRFEIM
ncbi:MAG TPA: SMC family ATPase [Armatimonadetes bacterium]|nr:SMC family ATPase [Armatimonadota bacterium]